MFKKLFKTDLEERTPENVGEDFANALLEHQDRMQVLMEMFKNLPDELVDWCRNKILDNFKNPKAYAEIEITSWMKPLDKKIFSKGIMLPGDMIIRTKSPLFNKGDLIEFAIRQKDEYYYDFARIEELKRRTNDVFIYIDENNDRINLDEYNVQFIVEIVSFKSEKWKNIVETFNLDYDFSASINLLKTSLNDDKKEKKFTKEELKHIGERLASLEAMPERERMH